MDQLLILLLIPLASWRITKAINAEQIGKGIRYRLAGEREDPAVPGLTTSSDTFLAEMIMCFRCLSFWISVLCLLIYLFAPLFLYPFAISTLVILLDERL
jgi:hypothetical protein